MCLHGVSQLFCLFLSLPFRFFLSVSRFPSRCLGVAPPLSVFSPSPYSFPVSSCFFPFLLDFTSLSPSLFYRLPSSPSSFSVPFASQVELKKVNSKMQLQNDALEIKVPYVQIILK